MLLCLHRDPSYHPSVSDHKSFLWSRRPSPCEAHSLVIYWNDVAKFDFLGSESSGSSGTSGFPEHPWCSVATSSPMLLTGSSCRFREFWSVSVATSFPVLKNFWASLSHPWELDAASGLEFLFDLTSSFPEHPTRRLEALSVPGLLDAIGLFTDEELEATELVKFIAVGLDFATILFPSFCSCILFAILLVQLIKLKFLAQQRELTWLMLNKWRRLFHSSRVKLPLVKMSESGCLVSMYRIWKQ